MRYRGYLPILAVASVLLLASCGGGGSTSSPTTTSEPTVAFHPPAQYQLAKLEQTPHKPCIRTDWDCARKFLDSIAKKYGPQAALEVLGVFERAGKINRSLDDHQLAHAVGRETAAEFGINAKAFQLCPITFNYGCVHGFFEYALGRTATPSAAAATICNSEKSDVLTTKFSCYHGVGHGVMMARAYDLHRALGVCDTLGDSTAEDGCWQGVFMENVNAAMRNKARPGIFSSSAPLKPCLEVAPKYRHECYINQAGWLVQVAKFDIGRATRYCLDAPSAFVSVCAQSIGLMVTNPTWQATLAPKSSGLPFAEIAWTLCERFPEQLRADCVTAGEDNIANFDNLDIGRATKFCGVVAPAYRLNCYGQIGVNLSRRSNDPAAINRTCASLGGLYGKACSNAAGKAEAAPPPPPTTTPTTTTPPPTTTEEKPSGTPKGAVVVTMENERFSPALVTIEKGQTVTFVNASDDDKWPASDFHPTHLLYPGFDALRSIPPGQSYSFTFEKRGRWTYHNHLFPAMRGTVVVR